MEVCTSQIGEIIVSGSVNATGRFVSAGQSEFIRDYENASFTAAGRFVVEEGNSGTITGDGVFQGDGVFSGLMVREGTFHISNAIPGEYSVRIVMDTGQEIQVDEKFQILRTPSAETRLVQVEGLSVNALLSQEDGSQTTGNVILTDTELQGDSAAQPCSDRLTSPCSIPIGEGGAISIGPIPARSHTISYDSDLDGFYDLVASVLPEDATTGSIDLDLIVPLTSDLEITLLSESGVIVPDLDLTIRGATGLGIYEMNYDSETETYKAELIPGEYHLNYTYGDTQIWELITLDEDLSMTAQFRTSSLLTGTVYTSDDDSTPEPDDYVQFAEVVARWSGFELSLIHI